MGNVQLVDAARSSISLNVGLSRLKKRVLILGTGELGRELFEIMLSKRFSLYEVIGFLERERKDIGIRIGSAPVLGIYAELFQVVERYHVQTILVCIEDRRAVLPVETLLAFKAAGVDVIDGHHVYEKESGRLSIDLIRPSALIFSTGFRHRVLSKALKRSLDTTLAIGGLIILAPIMAFVAILIKIDSPGPVFYRQMRVGLRSMPFMIVKFRSMMLDAEKDGPRWAKVNDPRISKVGWYLRKLRIDEIPQLYNVLRGEMSLVGPRPERPVFVDELRKIIPYYDIRHTVKPGITGWAQVKFRYGMSQEDAHRKLQYDLYYVKNLSFLLDLKVLVRTVRVILLGEGAH